jgi:pyruvate/2-oxoglutarate/acetoin dehydrogenase E1 component
VVVNEGYRTGNALNEIVTLCAEECFHDMKAPVVRVTGPDTPIPFSPVLEDMWIVQESDIIRGILKTLD